MEGSLISLGGSEANFLEVCSGRIPSGNFHTKATSKESGASGPPSGHFRPNSPELPRSPSRSLAGWKILLKSISALSGHVLRATARLLSHEVRSPLVALYGALYQERKSSLNVKFWAGQSYIHQGPRRRDIPDKNVMQVALFCCFRQRVAGMSWIWVGTSQKVEKLYARNFWADFLFPI